MTAGSAADRLHPAILYHLRNTLDWPALRPLQEAAVAPILEGADALLLAPTAGGKTEAAALPLLTRMAREEWAPTSLLYVCPLRALLNDLEPRLSRYASWLGRRGALWHGDTPRGGRRATLAQPPDMLLTTPESLEALLIGGREGARALLANLRAVLVDEVHALLGDDRGWHLLALLERVTRLCGQPLQRVGLSATVGNPEELLRRLQGPNATARPAELVASATPLGAPDVLLDYVGSLENAAAVVAALHRGEKRLVFCDSRRRVEELALALRGRGVRTFVSHASLAAEERRRSEQAFAESRDCVVVATSTLELGVDVGDLDRVFQVDSAGTVSGFLQRLGRSGRRGGAPRNCLFLATGHETLLQAAGLLRLWSDGWVEPVVPPPAPLHILAQQLIALALQEGRLARSGWREWLGGLPLASDDEADRVLAHLVAAGMLAADEGMLFVGPAAERSFGRRYFRELTSVFAATPELVVLHGRTEVGSVHPLAVAVAGEGSRRLLLAGQSWQVTHVDWGRRHCFVRPADAGGRARWPGVPQLLHGRLCRAMREVVLGAEPGVPLTARAVAWLPRAREELAGRVSGGGTVVAADATGRARWWTWAGGRANATLAAALPGLAEAPGRVENLAIRLRDGVDIGELRRTLRGLDLEQAPPPAVLEEAVRGLKFSEALPPELAVRVLQERLRDPEGAAWVLRQPGPVVVRSALG